MRRLECQWSKSDSLLEVKMEEVGTTLVRIEGVLGSLFQLVQGIDQRVDKLDQRVEKLDQRLQVLSYGSTATTTISRRWTIN